MENEEELSEMLRPAKVLDSLTDRYGLGTLVHYGDELNMSTTYALLADKAAEATPETLAWELVGVADTVEQSTVDGMKSAFRMVKDGGKLVLALATVAHGTGKYAVGRGETPEFMSPEELPEEVRDEFVAHDPNIFAKLSEGEVPVRVVEVVTPTGFASSIVMFSATGATEDRLETWTEGGETDGHGRSDLASALTGMFSWLFIARQTLDLGRPLTIESALATALLMGREGDTRHRGALGLGEGDSITAFMVRTVANAIDGGMIQFGEIPGSESESEN
jgi:hypothetical protein